MQRHSHSSFKRWIWQWLQRSPSSRGTLQTASLRQYSDTLEFRNFLRDLPFQLCAAELKQAARRGASCWRCLQYIHFASWSTQPCHIPGVVSVHILRRLYLKQKLQNASWIAAWWNVIGIPTWWNVIGLATCWNVIGITTSTNHETAAYVGTCSSGNKQEN